MVFYPPLPDDSCIYCDRMPRYKIDSDDPRAKHLAPYQIGRCCSTEWIREQFKCDGVAVEAVSQFGLKGSFRDYAARVFNAGPESDIGRWFIATYLT